MGKGVGTVSASLKKGREIPISILRREVSILTQKISSSVYRKGKQRSRGKRKWERGSFSERGTTSPEAGGITKKTTA